jgi:hypothetical protein
LVTMSGSMSPLMGRKTAALVALAEIDDHPLRRQSLWDEAFDAIYALPAGMQVGAMLEIAPVLTLQQCQQVLRDYDLILRDPRRQAVVDGVESIDAESGGVSKDERGVDLDVPPWGLVLAIPRSTRRAARTMATTSRSISPWGPGGWTSTGSADGPTRSLSTSRSAPKPGRIASTPDALSQQTNDSGLTP